MIPAKYANRYASRGLDGFIEKIYKPTLRLALNYRLIVSAACLSAIILTFGLQKSGIVKFTFFPRVDGNTLTLRFCSMGPLPV